MANNKYGEEKKRTEGKSKKRKKKRRNEFRSRNKLHCNIPSSVASTSYPFTMMIIIIVPCCCCAVWGFLSSSRARLIFSFIWVGFFFRSLLLFFSAFHCCLARCCACDAYKIWMNKTRKYYSNSCVSYLFYEVKSYACVFLFFCWSYRSSVAYIFELPPPPPVWIVDSNQMPKHIKIISDFRNADGFHCNVSLQFNDFATLVLAMPSWHIVCPVCHSYLHICHCFSSPFR